MTSKPLRSHLRLLRDLAPAFDLTQSMVRRIDGTVLYCTSGMCHLYGWTLDEMVGRCSHELLSTEFPKPLRDIDAELLRGLQWTGELKHRKRDGTVLWVASHWALHYDDCTGEAIVSEANNDITELKRTQDELRCSQLALTESRDRQRALSDRLLSAQDDERRRIAQDLHDDLCQKLAILAFDARNTAMGLEPSDLKRRVESLYDRIVGASQYVPRIAYQLHPSAVDDLGLGDALRALCDEFSQANTTVRFRLHGPAEAVPPDKASCLYRVLQEALVNAAKHSRARSIAVDVTIDSGRVRLSVKDTGIGFSADRTKAGLGLLNMQERVSRLHGQFVVGSEPGRGTRIQVSLPIPGPAANARSADSSAFSFHPVH